MLESLINILESIAVPRFDIKHYFLSLCPYSRLIFSRCSRDWVCLGREMEEKNLYKSHLCSASSAKTNDGNKFTRAQDQNKDNADCQNQSQPANSVHTAQRRWQKIHIDEGLGKPRGNTFGWKSGNLLGIATRNFWLLLTPGQYAVNLPECASRFGIAKHQSQVPAPP